MRRIYDLLYLLCFLPIFAVVRGLAAILSLVRFKSLIKMAHRALGVKNRVLYLEAFFPENAGYHYRTQKWIDILNENGYSARAKYVFEKERFEILINRQRVVAFHLISLLWRICQCLSAVSYNFVIVRRELLLFNDYGDLFLERFLLALHPRVILDFDDDISAAKREPRHVSLYGRLMFESPSKFRASLKMYGRFIVGTDYLKQQVLRSNGEVSESDILVIPTCVDYYRHAPKSYGGINGCIQFGWIGTTGNLPLLDIVIPPLNSIAKDHKIRLIVISGAEYKPEANFEVINLPWSLSSEVDDLRQIDVGLMPLAGTDEDRGKCGFKLLQYMGLGIVNIASAVTVNEQIVQDGRDGFLVRSESDWERVLRGMLANSNSEAFSEIGARARAKVRERFSYEAHTRRYIDFLKGRVA
ncbi:MAG TPA: glycosyltransferase [Blastocatellia bacterium]|nr:glycosyltransferase [Blastocatellia bacterium]